MKLPELSGDPLSSYINANYVGGWPSENRSFIATQGPLANTIVDFYRMIWQEKVPVIVMITRLFEKNKVKNLLIDCCKRKSNKFESSFRLNVNVICQIQDRVNMDHLLYTFNRYRTKTIMKFVD